MAAHAAKHRHKHMFSACTRPLAHTAHSKLAQAALHPGAYRLTSECRWKLALTPTSPLHRCTQTTHVCPAILHASASSLATPQPTFPAGHLQGRKPRAPIPTAPRPRPPHPPRQAQAACPHRRRPQSHPPPPPPSPAHQSSLSSCNAATAIARAETRNQHLSITPCTCQLWHEGMHAELCTTAAMTQTSHVCVPANSGRKLLGTAAAPGRSAPSDQTQQLRRRCPRQS